jgi:anti-sigma regulatory factor (Ser/Thr protein kinase)
MTTSNVGNAEFVGAVRALIRERLSAVLPEVLDLAVLLADEVVTNAVLHGGGEIGLSVDVTDDRLRVEVKDSSFKLPLVLTPNAEREHGRGMVIVDSLAASWGTEVDRSGKSVWFELGLPG